MLYVDVVSCSPVEPESALSVAYYFVFFLMIRRPPRSTLDRSSAASDVYKRQVRRNDELAVDDVLRMAPEAIVVSPGPCTPADAGLSLIHISEPTRPY